MSTGEVLAIFILAYFVSGCISQTDDNHDVVYLETAETRQQRNQREWKSPGLENIASQQASKRNRGLEKQWEGVPAFSPPDAPNVNPTFSPDVNGYMSGAPQAPPTISPDVNGYMSGAPQAPPTISPDVNGYMSGAPQAQPVTIAPPSGSKKSSMGNRGLEKQWEGVPAFSPPDAPNVNPTFSPDVNGYMSGAPQAQPVTIASPSGSQKSSMGNRGLEKQWEGVPAFSPPDAPNVNPTFSPDVNGYMSGAPQAPPTISPDVNGYMSGAPQAPPTISPDVNGYMSGAPQAQPVTIAPPSGSQKSSMGNRGLEKQWEGVPAFSPPDAPNVNPTFSPDVNGYMSGAPQAPPTISPDVNGYMSGAPQAQPVTIVPPSGSKKSSMGNRGLEKQWEGVPAFSPPDAPNVNPTFSPDVNGYMSGAPQAPPTISPDVNGYMSGAPQAPPTISPDVNGYMSGAPQAQPVTIVPPSGSQKSSMGNRGLEKQWEGVPAFSPPDAPNVNPTFSPDVNGYMSGAPQAPPTISPDVNGYMSGAPQAPPTISPDVNGYMSGAPQAQPVTIAPSSGSQKSSMGNRGLEKQWEGVPAFSPPDAPNVNPTFSPDVNGYMSGAPQAPPTISPDVNGYMSGAPQAQPVTIVPPSGSQKSSMGNRGLEKQWEGVPAFSPPDAPNVNPTFSPDVNGYMSGAPQAPPTISPDVNGYMSGAPQAPPTISPDVNGYMSGAPQAQPVTIAPPSGPQKSSMGNRGLEKQWEGVPAFSPPDAPNVNPTFSPDVNGYMSGAPQAPPTISPDVNGYMSGAPQAQPVTIAPPSGSQKSSMSNRGLEKQWEGVPAFSPPDAPNVNPTFSPDVNGYMSGAPQAPPTISPDVNGYMSGAPQASPVTIAPPSGSQKSSMDNRGLEKHWEGMPRLKRSKNIRKKLHRYRRNKNINPNPTLPGPGSGGSSFPGQKPSKNNTGNWTDTEIDGVVVPDYGRRFFIV